MNKTMSFIIKLLLILSLPIFFVSSCVVIYHPLFRMTEKAYTDSIDKKIPPDFPVLVFVRDPKANGFRTHVVYYRILDKFIQDNPDFTYLVPPGQEELLRKRLQKEPGDLLIADFKVKYLTEGKQWLEVIGMEDKDIPNTGWYEAADKQIFPKNYLCYFGPGAATVSVAISFGLTLLLWGIIIAIYIVIRKKRARNTDVKSDKFHDSP